jgi:hypothetical protein
MEVAVLGYFAELLSHSLQAVSFSGSPQPLFVRFVDSSHMFVLG